MTFNDRIMLALWRWMERRWEKSVARHRLNLRSAEQELMKVRIFINRIEHPIQWKDPDPK